MRKRCYSPTDSRYDRYGGRGIKVCSEWDDFLSFVKWSDENGYKENLTLDRKENDKNYSPDNCQWSDGFKQNQNTSRSKIWTIDGQDFPSRSEAAKFYNVNPITIKHWCDGQKVKGKFYPPKDGCSSRNKY